MWPLSDDANPQHWRVAYENVYPKDRTVIPKRAIEDALLMRGRPIRDDLAAYRRFIDEIVGR